MKAPTYTQHSLLGVDDLTVRLPVKRSRTSRSDTSERTLTWSYGGGTQSIALAVLVAAGRLPKPELTVFCDTGHEASVTWRYTERYVLPLLASVGVTIEIASHDLAAVDLYRDDTLLLPAWTPTGKLPTYCSSEWKKQVFRRYVRHLGGVQSCITWMGMSKDELDRVRDSDVLWQQYHYPLIEDVPLSRGQCRQVVIDAGLPPPPKSRCKFCPWQSNEEWRQLKEDDPEDFAYAVEYDEMIRQRDRLHAVYLHKSAKPLRVVDFTQSDAPSLFGDESGGCQSGYCMV